MNTLPRPLLLLALGSLLLPLFASTAPLTDAQQAGLRKAHRHEKHGWTYVHIEGEPRERGFQYGYLLAKEIAEGIRRDRVAWEYQSAMTWGWLVERADALFTLKIDAENLAELDGIAEGMAAAGVPSSRAELIAYNAWLELTGYWWPGEFKKLKEGAVAPAVRESCSAFIATGHMTRDGGVVLAHNSMSAYQEALPNFILDVAPARGHRILMQVWPGWIHSGTDFFVTDAGLVGAETTIGGFEGFDTNGIPEFARMRRATQDAGSIAAWCEIMRRENNGGYANAWLLGDVNSGEIARLELGLKCVGFEQKRDGFFLGSNVAEDPKLLRFETGDHETDIRKSNVARRVRWKELMARYAGRIDVALAQRFEADHYDPYLRKNRAGSRSLCGHFELDPSPTGEWPGAPFAPSGTFDAKVVDATLAKHMSFAARWGSACGRAFDAGRFLAEHPQFDWMKGILESRPSQPWTTFQAGEK
jgi:hypothetical protein